MKEEWKKPLTAEANSKLSKVKRKSKEKWHTYGLWLPCRNK